MVIRPVDVRAADSEVLCSQVATIHELYVRNSVYQIAKGGFHIHRPKEFWMWLSTFPNFRLLVAEEDQQVIGYLALFLRGPSPRPSDFMRGPDPEFDEENMIRPHYVTDKIKGLAAGDVGYFYAIAVHPEHQKRGVAYSLMSEMSALAESAGLKVLYCESLGAPVVNPGSRLLTAADFTRELGIVENEYRFFPDDGEEPQRITWDFYVAGVRPWELVFDAEEGVWKIVRNKAVF